MPIQRLSSEDKPKFLQARAEQFLHDFRKFGREARCELEPTVYLLDDFAITLNETRFSANLAVGMAIAVREQPVYVIESMVNCCGVVVVEIAGRVEVSALLSRFGKAGSSALDFKRKNHFVSVYERDDGSSVAIMHTSFPEVKTGHSGHPGLYASADGYFSRAGDAFTGEYGTYTFLTGDIAAEYENEVRYWDRYSCTRREEIAVGLFPECKILFSQSHVNVPIPGVTVLGGYYSPRGEDQLVLTEGPTHSARVYGMKDFHYVDVLGGYLAPHGSGIRFDCEELVVKDGRVLCRRGDSWTVVDELSDLPFGYNELPRFAVESLRPRLECKVSL